MKFGHHFEEALQGESYPKHWVETAVPYGKLKKVLTKVRQELTRRGYHPDTLRRLLENHDAEYRLDTRDTGDRRLRPRLTVRIRMVDHTSIDATLSSSTWATLQELSGQQERDENDDKTACKQGQSSVVPTDRTDTGSTKNAVAGEIMSGEWVEVPMIADGTFFDMLQTDVDQLDSLQHSEQSSMHAEIVCLGKEVAEAARPAKFSKSDLYRWREIFDLYLSAQVFFSTQGGAGASRDSVKAQQQLVWFQTEVQKRELILKFKLASSAAAYTRFVTLNARLLQSLQFQELNQRALFKIIKKFDKKTNLGVKQSLPVSLHSDNFMAQSVAKGICSQISQEVVSLVPQISDFLCPICFEIFWVPVRLGCHHLFCIRCVVKLQAGRKALCPLCRADSVEAADSYNMDPKLEAFLKRWFPKEVTEKQRSNDVERGKEMFGPDYEYRRCVVM